MKADAKTGASWQMFAACLPGLEPLLLRELTSLGTPARQLRGGVAFDGDLVLAMRACLWLGTASHVVLRLAEFPCRALGELQRKAAQLPWAKWLRRHVPIEVEATARGSRVYHTGAIVERIENAITTALGVAITRPAPGDELVARVHVRFANDVCTISLDATPTPLHRRGYRLDGAKAPLREDLAHAMVLAAGLTNDDAFLDPFCGSGTIAIEAAGRAAGLPPGRLRPPPLEHLALFDADAWQGLRSHGAPRERGAPIAASDRDAGAVEAARANAARAGVAERIEFSTNAFTAHPWLAAPESAPKQGVLVTNPPFGVRVAKAAELATLWQALGHRTARLGAGWRCTLLAHDVRIARRTGLPLRANWTTRHGGLAVTCLGTTIGAAPQDADGPARSQSR